MSLAETSSTASIVVAATNTIEFSNQPPPPIIAPTAVAVESSRVVDRITSQQDHNVVVELLVARWGLLGRFHFGGSKHPSFHVIPSISSRHERMVASSFNSSRHDRGIMQGLTMKILHINLSNNQC